MTLQELAKIAQQIQQSQSLKQQQQQQTIANSTSLYSSLLLNKPFWIWDRLEHRQTYDETKGKCCFNHIVPAKEPIKNGKRHRLYDYQKVIIDTLEQYRRLYLLKAGGIGASELLLRYMAYLCLSSSDRFKDSQMIIITGPRVDLSISLVRRLKMLFYPDIVFESKETVLELKGVRIEAFPSNTAIHSARGLPNVSFILCDEAAFFDTGSIADVRSILDRYQLKSNCYTAIISTPHRPGDLMYQIHNEAEETCAYRRLYMDIEVSRNKLYTSEEIEHFRKTLPSFEREFMLSWTASGIGNTFSTVAISRAIELGQQPGGSEYHPSGAHFMGVDIAFGQGVSNTAITVVQALGAQQPWLQIIHSEELEAPDFNRLIHHIVALCSKYKTVHNIYIDASAPSVISSVKRLLNDYPTDTYLDRKAQLEKDYPSTPIERFMRVIPVAFTPQHRQEMLSNLHSFIDDDRGIMGIHPKYDRLISSLRGAISEDNKLIKDDSPFNDSLDSCMLALNGIRYVPQTR